MFDAAAARMSSNPHALGGRPSATYRAKGIIRCPFCDSVYVGIRNHGYKRYGCSNSRDRVTGKRKCPGPSLAGDATESALLGAIKDVLADERHLEASVSKHRAELAGTSNTADVEKLRKRL